MSVAVIILFFAAPARAQEVRLSASTDEIYAELPFVLSLEARGFDEAPEPEAPKLEVAGCDITSLGVTPNIASHVQIVNGRRTERRVVTFAFRWRVTARAAGTCTVPALTVRQGARSATSQAATFTAREVAATPDMKVRVTLPERPAWVGEVFPVEVDWYLKQNVTDHTFVVPLFDREDAFEVAAGEPPADPRQRLAFAAGAREVQLPFARDRATLDGVEYTRFRFRAAVAAVRPGRWELAPARVLARLEVGTGRDRFGFPVAKTQLFKAEDRPRTLEVRALPAEGRPASFAGAVGAAFEVEVEADRSVVRAGDPIELEITLRGRGRLDGLVLPPLGADGGLSPALFSFPEGSPPGEVLADEGAKRFKVAVRVRSEQAREIPPLAFSFFNPERGEYRTVRSRPIALSVKGSAVVGADSVVAATGEPAATRETAPGPGDGGGGGGAAALRRGSGQAIASLVGADLALSEEGRTLRPVLDVRGALPILGALYAIPLAILAARVYLARTQGRRTARRDVRRALDRCLAEIDAAAQAGAREGGSRLAGALRGLARDLGGGGDGDDVAAPPPLIARLEALAFDPGSAGKPVDPALADEVREAARSLPRRPGAAIGVARGVRRRRAPRGELEGGDSPPSKLVVALVASLGLAAGSALAMGALGGRLEEARTAYREALAEPDRDRRVAGFARAEALLGALAAEHPASPELLADWGNAALGAAEPGKAVLAYRRALALDPGGPRARKNLAWARSRLPDWLPAREEQVALDTLFFWHATLSRATRLILGAAAFAAACLLVAPWSPRGARARRALAALALLAWLALTVSAAIDRGPANDAVIVAEGVVLRAADSAGAPPVLARPLPAGAEVEVLETRPDPVGAFARVALADGTRGWVRESAIARVSAAR